MCRMHMCDFSLLSFIQQIFVKCLFYAKHRFRSKVFSNDQNRFATSSEGAYYLVGRQRSKQTQK